MLILMMYNGDGANMRFVLAFTVAISLTIASLGGSFGIKQISANAEAEKIYYLGLQEYPDEDPLADAFEYNGAYYRELDDGTLEFAAFKGDAADFRIDSEVNGKKVTKIGKKASACGICPEDLVIPEGIKEIEDSAFDMGNSQLIKTVKLPHTLERIGNHAFYLSGIESVEIPDSVTYVGNGAFAYCLRLSYVKLPKGLEELNSDLFYMSSLGELDIPDGVKVIKENAFSGSQIKTVVLPEGVTDIAGSAFSMSGAKDVYLPKSATNIGENCFMMFNLTDIDPVTEEQTGYYTPSDIVLHCWKDSAALKYAEEKGLKYVLRDDESDKPDDKPTDGDTTGDQDDVKGDINGDGVVNITDVSKLAAHVKGVRAMEGDALARADVDGSGKVNVTDVSKLAAHVKNIRPLS